MDTTFISIHDLSLDARLLYVSNSIGDVLGYHPEEVVGKSCWEYFHPDEIPFARLRHGRGIELDKAAVLSYCRIKASDSTWVGCECCFTVVHDVLVGCTSIYRADLRSRQRAMSAPIIRQIFTAHPLDPRYHMLSYISAKFSEGPSPHLREPRAALFLNRFTRSLTIMYATNGLEDTLGVSSSELTGKSFYYCIQENCLGEAIDCLERAKANDSIAYLRFWYRDPRTDDKSDHNETMSDAHSSECDDEDGGVDLNLQRDGSSDSTRSAETQNSDESSVSSMSILEEHLGVGPHGVYVSPASNSNGAASVNGVSSASSDGHLDPIFDRNHMRTESSETSVSPNGHGTSHQESDGLGFRQPIELEAVISCTSDGLVVVLRAARPFVPDSIRQAPRAHQSSYYSNKKGVFASPWASEPMIPEDSTAAIDNVNRPGYHDTGRPNAIGPVGGPAMNDFMRTIKEAAVFAWALTGINGSLAQYATGTPAVGAQPFGGLPVYEPDARRWDDADRMQE